MFDMVGYRLLDKGYVKNYLILSMLQIADNKVAFGHQFGIITLWETSKRYLTQDEIDNMRNEIMESEMSQLDQSILNKHNVQAKTMVEQMPQIRRINTILDNA